MTAVTLKPDEQSVIAAVSCAFSAPWRPGENPPDAYICLDGDDVPVEISTLTQLVTDKEAKDGTRAVMGDYIATGALGDDLDRELAPMIPEGYRIVLWVTEAPINRATKTKRRLTKYYGAFHRPSDFPAPHCVEVNRQSLSDISDHTASLAFLGQST